jgi:hypothetical protein
MSFSPSVDNEINNFIIHSKASASKESFDYFHSLVSVATATNASTARSVNDVEDTVTRRRRRETIEFVLKVLYIAKEESSSGGRGAGKDFYCFEALIASVQVLSRIAYLLPSSLLEPVRSAVVPLLMNILAESSSTTSSSSSSSPSSPPPRESNDRNSSNTNVNVVVHNNKLLLVPFLTRLVALIYICDPAPFFQPSQQQQQQTVGAAAAAASTPPGNPYLFFRHINPQSCRALDSSLVLLDMFSLMPFEYRRRCSSSSNSSNFSSERIHNEQAKSFYIELLVDVFSNAIERTCASILITKALEGLR